MTLTLWLLIIFSAVELLLWLPPLWRVRRIVICGLIPVIALLSGLVFGQYFNVGSGLVFVLSIYRLINLLRILENRLQAKQLYLVSRRTSYLLIAAQLLSGAGAAASRSLSINSSHWLLILSGATLLASFILAASTVRHLRTTQPPIDPPRTPDKNVPTLSVLVPARNETEDLEACLRTLISSDYPKLEILVLDDCSQNKRTPEIIKDYAHAGVRFIAGDTPRGHWLAKNYAYHQLVKEASGELLLFCGVDTRFTPESLSMMVDILAAKHKQMVSFIPANKSLKNPLSLLVQPARYAWELTLPRRLFSRPPVLSTCWIIKTDSLKDAGGFEATANSVSVESFFARYTAGHNDGYSFLQSNNMIGLTSVKSLSEQRDTAIRTRYPQLHRRPELTGLQSLLEFLFLITPFAVLVGSIVSGDYALTAINAISCVVLLGGYARIITLTYRRRSWLGLFALPFAALYDIGLLNYSMWQYEFRKVIWKGRNVCLPLTQPVPERPSLTDIR